MSEVRFDQAAGLRRMQALHRVRAVAFASGVHGVGTTTAVINVAAALAAGGRRVLVIDDSGGRNSAPTLLGLRPRFGLAQVLRAACAFDDALLSGECGFDVLAASGEAKPVARLRAHAGVDLNTLLGALGERYDLVLIDAGTAEYSPRRQGPLVAHTIVVSAPAAPTITAAYALVKRLCAQSCGALHVLLTCADSKANARVIFDNLKALAASRLHKAIDCLGAIACDEHIARSRRTLAPVTHAYPASSAAADFRRVAQAIAAWPARCPLLPAADQYLQRTRVSSPSHVYAGVQP